MSEVQERIKRSSFATFLNIGTKEAAEYARFGKGIEEQDINYNPETETIKYIDEDSSNTDLTGYAPSFDTTQRTYKNEPIFEYMYKKMLARAIGSEAITDYIKVYMFDKLAEGTYMAEKCDCTVSISTFKGSEIGYTVNENGDPISGYVVVDAQGKLTFTEGKFSA